MTAITQPYPTSNRSGAFVYVAAAPAQALGTTPSDMLGVVALAAKGQPNIPQRVGSRDDFIALFGPETINPATGQPLSGYLAIEAIKAQGAYDVWLTRVMDATGATAYVTLKTAGGAAICALVADSPGTWARALGVTTAPNAGAPALTDVTIANAATGKSETIYGVDFTNNAGAIAAISGGSTQVDASQPLLDPLLAAPAAAAGSGGALLAGGYYAIVTKRLGTGETTGSPESGLITVGANGTITIPAVVDAQATAIAVYLTAPNGAPGSETFATTGAPGAPIVISAPPSAAAQQPPTLNTAVTGPGAAAAPVAGTVAFVATTVAGANAGNDGANVTAAAHVGTASPLAGANAFTGLDVKPNIVILAGDAGADPTQWQAQADLARANGWQAFACPPRPTTPDGVAAAMTAAASVKASPSGGSIAFEYPWYTVYDPLVGGTIQIPPTAIAAGITAVQPPNASGANKPVNLGFGASPVPTDRIGPQYDLSDAQVQSLIALGVNPHTRHIPGGGIGREKDLLLGVGPGGVTRGAHLRMINLTVRALGDLGGQFAEDVDTPQLRTNVESAALGWLQARAGDGLIPGNPAGVTQNAAQTTTAATTTGATAKRASPSATPQTTTSASATSTTTQYYYATCDDTTNPPGGPRGLLACEVGVSYYGIAEQIVFTLFPTIGTAQVGVAAQAA